MAITRRDFLKISSATGAGLLFGVFDLKPIAAYAGAPTWGSLTPSICCYCGVGCGLLVGTDGNTPSTSTKVTYVQGDPDHPINKGSLCSKGGGMAQLRTVDGALNLRRLTQPLYRASGAATWSPVSWAWAIDTIANRIKTTRDGINPQDGLPNTITEEEIDGIMTPTNRCRAIASFGGAAHDTEECYLLIKMLRALGLVYIEHQARI